MNFIEIINKNKEQFEKFNQIKLERFYELCANSHVEKTINSIPLLLSVNSSKIPGYINGNVPYGIVGYTPDVKIQKHIETRFRTTNVKIENKKPFIEMFAIMGSSGTIAYTKNSDFDYWVCINKQSVPKEELNNFRKKVELISEWVANDTKLEVHFFINDVEDVKKNIYDEDENEAFGSTIGALLKDEFYRSSIIIAGKIPFWWVIPQFVDDSEYQKLFDKLPEEIKEKDFVDIGNLFHISKEDFIGAALFQLIKSLGNPFKSILKIGILEKYLFDTQESPLLSQFVKSNVIRGNFEKKILDSYILMFEEVYNYYKSTLKDKNMLKILRQNLYLKINPQLSKYSKMKESKKLPYKVSVMFDYIREWKWNDKEIAMLDNFESWDYNRIMGFWNLVKKFMLICYQDIARELPNLNLAKKISESDFKLLTRKIKTNFLSLEDKIDQYVTFKDTPHESVLYIEPVSRVVDETEWRLFKNIKDPKNNVKSTTVKTESDLVKLLAWVSINRIFDPVFSRLKIKSGYERINQNNVLDLLTKISKLFNENVISLKNEFFLKPSFYMLNMLIINFNLENEKIIKSIYYLYKTSWGESYIKKYRSGDELIFILKSILTHGVMLKRNFNDYCVITSPEPMRQIYREIEKKFKSAYDFVVMNTSKKSLCMVLYLENMYVIVFKDNKGGISIVTQKNFINMIVTISLKPQNNMLIKFHGEESRLKELDLIYKKSRDNSITIIYEKVDNFIIFYIINERGNLFSFIKHISNMEIALACLYNFCKNVIKQINSLNYLPDINKNVIVYNLLRDKSGEPEFQYETEKVENLLCVKVDPEKCISAVISKYMAEENYYCLEFPHSITTDFMPLKSLQMNIKSLIGNDREMLNYIFRIEFKDIKTSDLKSGSSIYFQEKFKIDLFLGKAINQQ